jgi:hypothetical protein
MKQKKLSLVLILLIAGFHFTLSKENSSDKRQAVSAGSMMEGIIMSTDIEHNAFVMKTLITRTDTIHIGKSAIIKAGRHVAGRKDLKPENYVKAKYELEKGKKVATSILTYPEGSFLSDTTDLGKSVLIAEGTIQSVDETGSMMVLKAPLEKEYIFSLDPDAVIKSGMKHIPLKDLQPNYEIKVIYSEKGSRNIATSIEAKDSLKTK